MKKENQRYEMKESVIWIKYMVSEFITNPDNHLRAKNLKEFSKLANISNSYLTKIMTGSKLPSLLAAFNIAKVLNTEPKKLIFKVLYDKSDKNIKNYFQYCTCNTQNQEGIKISRHDIIFKTMKEYNHQAESDKKLANEILKIIFKKKYIQSSKDTIKKGGLIS
ncbi:MAG: helix-turn-helix transcriptional regulator [Pseudomonadota bacterium]